MRRLSGGWVPFDEVKKRSLSAQRPHQRYLLLHGEEAKDEAMWGMLKELPMALQYAKLPFDRLTFSEWNETAPSLLPYAQGAVIVIGEKQSHLRHADRLQSYVTEQGGLLVNALRSSDSPLNAFMGIVGRPKFAKHVRGLRWLHPIYPGLYEQVVGSSKASPSSLAVELDPDVCVWAESTEPHPTIPLVWRVSRGNGHALYWNNTLLHGKGWRGTFIQTLLKAQGLGVKATVGGFVIYLDDFPSPTWRATSSGNKTGMTDREFRSQRWDPDMKALADKYGFRYSSGCILSYNEKVRPAFEPFRYEEEGHSDLYRNETEIAKQWGEVGLHGYNHNPLTLSYTSEQKQALGYPAWASVEAMRQSLQVTRKLWRDYLQLPMPTFYIPASNVLSREGKRVLLEVFPEIRTISSSYGESERSAVFAQEYLPDPHVPQLMGTPRMTYGYYTSTHRKFDLYSGIGMIGIVSHFIHPDDVFSAGRSEGKSWDELLGEFDAYMEEVVERFSWMQALTATELADALRHFHAADVRIDRSEEGRLTAYATPLGAPLFLEMHVADPADWRVSRGGEIVASDERCGMLWVKMVEPKLVLKRRTGELFTE